MQRRSPNLIRKCSTMSPGKPFILGSKGQSSRSRVTKTVLAWSVHSYDAARLHLVACVVFVDGEDGSSVERSRRQLTQRLGAGSGDAASVKSASDVSLRRECSSDADSTTYRPRPSGIGILEFSPDRAGLDVTPANLYQGSPDRAAARYSNKLSTVAGRWIIIIIIIIIIGSTATKSGAAALKTAQNKIDKYAKVHDKHSHLLYSFTVETAGTWHDMAIELAGASQPSQRTQHRNNIPFSTPIRSSPKGKCGHFP